MRRLWLVLAAVAILAKYVTAQADGCRGASSALSRVKEEITPELGKDPANTFERDRLKTMFRTLEAASHVCQDMPELYYYRALIAERLGDKREADYSSRKQKELNYQPSYNPFTISAAQLADSEPPPGPVAKKWALVVGINEFQDKTIPTLRFAAKDSQDFTRYLTDSKGGRFEASRVKNLVDSSATVKSFWEGFGWLRSNASKDDLVVIYLSSHGSPRESDPNGVSFILLNDSDASDKDKIFATSVEMIDLVQRLNREIKARRLVLFLDTCYSGDASAAGQQTGGSRKLVPVWTTPPPEAAPAGLAYGGGLDKLKTGNGRVVITASRANELSWEGKSFTNGYFTHYLISALRQGENTSLDELFPKIKNEVSVSVGKDYPGQTQTPTFDFNGRAAGIVLDVPEQAH